jgi:hypothetical protein
MPREAAAVTEQQVADVTACEAEVLVLTIVY